MRTLILSLITLAIASTMVAVASESSTAASKPRTYYTQVEAGKSQIRGCREVRKSTRAFYFRVRNAEADRRVRGRAVFKDTQGATIVEMSSPVATAGQTRDFTMVVYLSGDTRIKGDVTLTLFRSSRAATKATIHLPSIKLCNPRPASPSATTSAPPSPSLSPTTSATTIPTVTGTPSTSASATVSASTSTTPSTSTSPSTSTTASVTPTAATPTP